MYFLFVFLTLLAIPATVHSSDSEMSYDIERQKLICLNDQINDLPEESVKKDMLVMVILTDSCLDSSGTKIYMASRSLPKLHVDTSNAPSDSSKKIIRPDDIWMLTQEFLECFKQHYDVLRVEENKPLTALRKACAPDKKS